MIKNEDGLVYIENWNSNDTFYTKAQNNISLGLVKEEDLPEIMALEVKACCNHHRKQFHFASQNNINIWHTGHI